MDAIRLTPKDKRLIRQIQGDIPLSPTPFAQIARQAGWEEKKLLRRVRFFLQRGIVRRFGAILRHQKAGYRGNAMTVWKVPEKQIARTSQVLAAFPEITHCYLRPSFPEWPFNLYAMVHGRSEKDCRLLAKKISQKTGIKEYRLLFS